MQFRRGLAVYFALGVSRRIRIDWWSYMTLMYDSEAKFESADAIQFRKIRPTTSKLVDVVSVVDIVIVVAVVVVCLVACCPSPPSPSPHHSLSLAPPLTLSTNLALSLSIYIYMYMFVYV